MKLALILVSLLAVFLLINDAAYFQATKAACDSYGKVGHLTYKWKIGFYYDCFGFKDMWPPNE